MTTTTIVLVVSPSLNVDGRKVYSTRGQLFDGRVDHRIIVKRSTTPFCDAARVLLAHGVRPETVLVMRHHDSSCDALRSTIGTAAGLTVVDDKGGKPIFVGWKQKPYEALAGSSSAPPMREMESPATLGTRRTRTRTGGRTVSPSSILARKPVYGDRAVHYAECAIGVFRTRTAGRRVVLTLNDGAIDNHCTGAGTGGSADRGDCRGDGASTG